MFSFSILLGKVKTKKLPDFIRHNPIAFFRCFNVLYSNSKSVLCKRITIMSSLAREESRSISKNVTRGKRK